MADVGLNINCGCGFTAHRLEEAVRHSDLRGHKMDIFGMITPDSKAKPEVNTTKPTEWVLGPDTNISNTIKSLRTKINGRR